MTNIINQVAYLPTTRSFPSDLQELPFEINKAYVDIASAVNTRVIGIYPASRPAINGQDWFFSGKKQQGFRQVYSFTTFTSIRHGITVSSVARFTNCYGSYTDGTNWYGVIYATSILIPGQLSFYIDPTNIVLVDGAGGRPPITLGTIVLEWIGDPVARQN